MYLNVNCRQLGDTLRLNQSMYVRKLKILFRVYVVTAAHAMILNLDHRII